MFMLEKIKSKSGILNPMLLLLDFQQLKIQNHSNHFRRSFKCNATHTKINTYLPSERILNIEFFTAINCGIHLNYVKENNSFVTTEI